jgi:hypothetical protein
MAVARRTRRPTKGAGTVDELKVLVNSLIKENQRLKRQLVRLETKTVGLAPSTATRALTAIARRLERALGSDATGRRRRGTSSSTAGRTRRSSTTATKARKPASPETQAKRLAALARAREARAAKKAETA